MKSRPPIPEGKRVEVDFSSLSAIVERAGVTAEEREQLKGAVETLAFLTRELESKSTSLERLRRFLFGGSEKTSTVLGPAEKPEESEGTDAGEGEEEGKERKRKGHGRNGAEKFPGAKKVQVPHATLQRGAQCPGCPGGKVYPLQEPATLVRITGMAPLYATVYECARLRCNLCGEVFKAPAPELEVKKHLEMMAKDCDCREAFRRLYSLRPVRANRCTARPDSSR